MNRTQNFALIFSGTAAMLAALANMSYGLWFAPGWANEWPFGLKQNVVWPTGMAALAFTAVLVGGVGGGLAARAALDEPLNLRRPTGWFRVWLLGSIAAAIAVATGVFLEKRELAIELWP